MEAFTVKARKRNTSSGLGHGSNSEIYDLFQEIKIKWIKINKLSNMVRRDTLYPGSQRWNLHWMTATSALVTFIYVVIEGPIMVANDEKAPYKCSWNVANFWKWRGPHPEDVFLLKGDYVKK